MRFRNQDDVNEALGLLSRVLRRACYSSIIQKSTDLDFLVEKMQSYLEVCTVFKNNKKAEKLFEFVKEIFQKRISEVIKSFSYKEYKKQDPQKPNEKNITSQKYVLINKLLEDVKKSAQS